MKKMHVNLLTMKKIINFENNIKIWKVIMKNHDFMSILADWV